jgi:heptosyltransferase-2
MKQILVIQNKRIGDVLISSVIANNLKKVFPESQITYFVYDYTSGVIEGNPNINQILRINEKWLKKIKNLYTIIRQIRKAKYDIIVDPYAKTQSKLICYFSGADIRIGFKRKGKKHPLSFYTHPIEFLEKRSRSCGKAIENRVHLIQSVFPFSEANYVPKIYLQQEEENYSALASIKKPVVMLGVLGSTPQKSMPYKYVAQLIDHIAATYNPTILFNYAPHQKEEAEKIYALCRHQENINLSIYEDSIRGFIKLMNKCDILVANEGGSVHIAKALNKPTFTIYSPYIEKASWDSFEDGITHNSIHLLEEKPNLYDDFSREKRKEIEENPALLYNELSPDLILKKLNPFLKHHLAQQPNVKSTTK